MTSNRFGNTSVAVGALFTVIVLSNSCANSSTPARVHQVEPAIIGSNPMGCQTNQLSVRRVKEETGLGNVGVTYAFTNTGSSVCTLKGYPGFELLDTKGQKLKGVRVNWSEGTYFQKDMPPQQVTLAPGTQALFQIAYNNGTQYPGQSCPESTKVEITPPNAYQHFTLPEHIQTCWGKIEVTPVRAEVVPVK